MYYMWRGPSQYINAEQTTNYNLGTPQSRLSLPQCKGHDSGHTYTNVHIQNSNSCAKLYFRQHTNSFYYYTSFLPSHKLRNDNTDSKTQCLTHSLVKIFQILKKKISLCITIIHCEPAPGKNLYLRLCHVPLEFPKEKPVVFTTSLNFYF